MSDTEDLSGIYKDRANGYTVRVEMMTVDPDRYIVHEDWRNGVCLQGISIVPVDHLWTHIENGVLTKLEEGV